MRPVFVCLLSALLLAGCASAPVRLPERNELPVSVCAVPDYGLTPRLAIDVISETAPDKVKAAAMAASIVQLLERVRWLEEVLASMKKPASPSDVSQ